MNKERRKRPSSDPSLGKLPNKCEELGNCCKKMKKDVVI